MVNHGPIALNWCLVLMVRMYGPGLKDHACVCLSVCPCAIGKNRGRVGESDREILGGGVGGGLGFRV